VLKKVFSMDESKKKVEYAKAVLKEIKEGKIKSLKDLELRQYPLCKDFNLTSLPTRPFILKQAKNPSKLQKQLLSIKPTRSISGVQIIAVMLPPFPCPGKCNYCPIATGDQRAPKSYTGFEPSAMRAQRLNFDSYKIVENRISQLDATGHKAEKIELIFQGSTFTTLTKPQREEIVKKSIDGALGKVTKDFVTSKKLIESAKRRVVGITFETRPDYCNQDDIEHMLYLGGTRIEIGVQSPNNKVYEMTKRGHTIDDVKRATRELKDSSFKVLYHLMPGLPGSTYKSDLRDFKKVFSDPDYRPDMVKFYPCLVIKGSELYEEWKKGNFTPMEEKKSTKLLVEVMKEIPPWVRIMRINRDIPSTVIEGGVKKTNLRQLVENELKKQKVKCQDIRSREIGINSLDEKSFKTQKPRLRTRFYEASKGKEAFISYESKDYLHGFVRLRDPYKPFMKNIDDKTALIRELHVYGPALPIGGHEEKAEQHKGIGKLLMNEAEKIAKDKFDAKKINVISGLGVREYYKKNFGYKTDEPYVSKKI
jgi:elongator complex protein 3